MMKKVYLKFYAFSVCIIIFLISLIGCSNQVDSDEIQSETSISDESQSETSMSEQNKGQSNVVVEDEPIRERPLYIAISDGFSDGVAIASWKNSEEDPVLYGFINTKGEIYFEFPEGYVASASNPSVIDGYYYADYHYDYADSNRLAQFIILDTKGNITYTSPADEYYRVLASGDGIFMVEQKTLSITENTSKIGFMKADGTWLVEPNIDKTDISEKQILNNAEIDYYYLGEGMFSIVYNGEYTLLISSKTGSKYELEDVSIGGIGGVFCNGFAYGWNSKEDHYVRISNTGEKMDFTIDENYYLSDTFDGFALFFQHDPGSGETNLCIYDMAGNLISDFSKEFPDYKLYKEVTPWFVDKNHIAVVIDGADGEKYLDTFDVVSKTFSFEPISITAMCESDCRQASLVKLRNGDNAIVNLLNGKINTLPTSVVIAFGYGENEFASTGAHLYEDVFMAGEQLYDWNGNEIEKSFAS